MTHTCSNCGHSEAKPAKKTSKNAIVSFPTACGRWRWVMPSGREAFASFPADKKTQSIYNRVLKMRERYDTAARNAKLFAQGMAKPDWFRGFETA